VSFSSSSPFSRLLCLVLSLSLSLLLTNAIITLLDDLVDYFLEKPNKKNSPMDDWRMQHHHHQQQQQRMSMNSIGPMYSHPSIRSRPAPYPYPQTSVKTDFNSVNITKTKQCSFLDLSVYRISTIVHDQFHILITRILLCTIQPIHRIR